MKRIIVTIFIVTLLLTQALAVNAATKPKTSSAGSFSASGQYIKAKNVVRAYFGNLKGIKKITYVLTYIGNGVGQGIEGSLLSGKKTSFSKDLYLGTCSGKVCINHKNIKNIKLEATARYTNGKSSSKIYKVK